MKFIQIDRWLCQSCGGCVSVCSFLALKIECGQLKLINDNCKQCLNCIQVCPNSALQVVEE
ncbi:MAG: 4Fe-4S binding protein [bacterium]